MRSNGVDGGQKRCASLLWGGMAESIDISTLSDEPEPDDMRYTAFETWEYPPLLWRQEHSQSWIDLAESFYRTAEHLVDGVAAGKLLEDVEGVAGVFAFRHFLELSLKGIVASGRWLVAPYENASPEHFEKAEKTHNLATLWEWVLQDARPKLGDDLWGRYDVAFVEKCIAEFHAADTKGFAWRYPGQGCEVYRYDFASLRLAMRHVRLVLNGIRTCLDEQRAQNAEWKDELRSMAE